MIGKDQGKHGLVNSIIKERNWVYVEGLNCVSDFFTNGACYNLNNVFETVILF